MEWWQYSELYNLIDSLANWGGPLPSTLGICLPREDIVYITSYHNTKANLKEAIHLMNKAK